MHLRTHLEIGLAALSRGYVELQRLADAVAELHRADPAADTDFWLRPGLMTRTQLDDVLAAVANGSRFVLPSTEAADPPTVAFGESPTVHQREGKASSSSPSTSDAATGTRGGDRYTELAVLGAGGMGAIVECMDRELGRRVALKLLKPEFLDDATAARMLEREARVTGSLEHPNIVPVYDIGSTLRGGPFYVMRLVEQPTLGEVLIKLAVADAEATASYTTGRLLRHFIQICETVDYAHSRGVVHCDLKPANVLLGNFGEVLVLDWGLAYRSLEGTSYRGGTPGYMAPEQLDETRKSTIDARTDVYALGVILYEMLALESYSESATALIKSKPHTPSARGSTRRPSVRAPSRQIAAELDEICARALHPEPDRRFQSARDVAQAVAAFLEGTREKERRQLRAADLTDEGDRLAGSYFEFLETRPERLAELGQVRAVTAPWEPAVRKRALWDEEDRLAITDALGVRTLHAAIASYEQALDEVPGHPAARGGLARLYRAQLERAEERREELDRIYFEELVKYYDDGSVLSSMRAEGRLELEVRPPASVTLAAIEEVDRRLQAVRPQRLGTAPAAGAVSVPLPPGRHVVTVSASGQVVRLPILMRAGRTMRATIDLEHTRPEAEEVLVPGGPALLDADGGGGLIEVDVPAFFMARFAVTFGEYLEFVASLQRDEPLRAVAHAPRGRDGALYWRWGAEDDGPEGYVPARIATFGANVPELLRLPVFGIDALSAEAYASWRSRVSGRAYRLSTEQEWEKAGRGTDGRIYPWGDRFDASFCKMRQSRPGLPRPEPVGSFPIDESPYGVRDLAGGISEWVHPLESLDASDATQRAMLSRGGAWSDWSADCNLTARRPYLAVERSSRIGFRLVRSA